MSARQARRVGLPPSILASYLLGEEVRDWSGKGSRVVLYPYSQEWKLSTFEAQRWFLRTNLEQRRTFQGVMADAGLAWWDFMQHTGSAYSTPLSITFSNVATHNHFALNRGSTVFSAHAPVIKLPVVASVEEHLQLVGLLNSSVACFWMKQVSHNKGASVDSKGARQTTVAWDNFYEHDGTKLQQFPLPDGAYPVDLAARLDAAASELASLQPADIADEAPPLRPTLGAARARADVVFAGLVSLHLTSAELEHTRRLPRNRVLGQRGSLRPGVSWVLGV